MSVQDFDFAISGAAAKQFIDANGGWMMADLAALRENRQVKLVSYPHDLVRDENFVVRASPLRALQPGEVLLAVRYISIDPGMRIYMDPDSIIGRNENLRDTFVRAGDTVRAWVVGEVIDSASEHFPIGSFARDLHGGGGVQDYSIVAEDGLSPVDPAQAPLPAYLGVLGMVGLTAYAGLVDIGNPHPGETVLISGAAGGVGGIAGQIAKAMGCRVVGIAGGPDKATYVVERLGFDACIDHKAGYLSEAINRHCPDGVDIYFDNVGGEVLDTAITHINSGARIVACGAISAYNGTPRPLHNYLNILVRQARWEGFSYYELVADKPRYARAVEQLTILLEAGKLRCDEHIFDGLDAFVPALQALYAGTTMGKVMLRLGGED